MDCKGFEEIGWYCVGVIEIGESCAPVRGASIKHRLRRFFHFPITLVPTWKTV